MSFDLVREQPKFSFAVTLAAATWAPVGLCAMGALAGAPDRLVVPFFVLALFISPLLGFAGALLGAYETRYEPSLRGSGFGALACLGYWAAGGLLVASAWDVMMGV